MTVTAHTETGTTPVLHIEARVRNSGDNVIIRTDIVREEVTRWLAENFAVLSLGQEITSFGLGTPAFPSSLASRGLLLTAFLSIDDLPGVHSRYLDSVKVIECTSSQTLYGPYRLAEVALDVQAYQLRQSEIEGSQQQTDNAEQDSPQAKVVLLPSKDLDGIWESLLFDEPIPTKLLRAVSRMMLFSCRKLNVWTINWNRLVLLYGPPGTGKTSLCYGLAQKLAIRLGRQFPQSKLIEINAHSLGSKFFSESGKLVSRMFASIEATLDDEPDTLVCVFVDEVETLTARREQSLNGNDPFDAMRAVNALLTALDRLRHHPNVVVFCTSNLITALDPAFLDRIDIKQFVPHPSEAVIYDIYKSCLEDLGQCGLIKGATFDVVARANPDNTDRSSLQYICQRAEALKLPSYGETILSYKLFGDSVPKQLSDISSRSVGLSGRTLRRLPALSLVLHTGGTCCMIEEAIVALAMGVEEELRAQAEAEQHH